MISAFGRLTQWAVSLMQLAILISLGYHYLLLLGGIREKTYRHRDAEQPSFAVVIPAHNEEASVPEPVASILRQAYPAHLVDVYVVADHCTDRTAEAARRAGALVLERNQGLRGQKGYALKWGLDHILAGGRPYDAIAIFDADSVLRPQCLAAFAPFIGDGYPVLQGRKTIRNAQDTPFTSLDDLDTRLSNLLKSRAKTNLGLSARLMGNVMCFRTELLKQHGWPTGSLVEDREFGMQLLLSGIRATYVPDAESSCEALHGWQDATSQRLRWIGGGQSLARAYAGRFLAAWVRQFRPELLDQFLELVLPTYTMSLAISFILLVAVVAVPGIHPLLGPEFSAGLFLLWVAFPILGLIESGAPLESYRALLHAPAYVIWRLSVGLRARLTARSIGWGHKGQNK